jgi:hypothetical protein
MQRSNQILWLLSKATLCKLSLTIFLNPLENFNLETFDDFIVSVNRWGFKVREHIYDCMAIDVLCELWYTIDDVYYVSCEKASTM